MTDADSDTPFQRLLRRTLKGRTQEAIGAMVGVDQSRISRWLAGKGLPDGSQFPTLAVALGVSIETLVRTVARSRRP